MDLHDHEASLREGDARPERNDVEPVAWGPGREPGGIRDGLGLSGTCWPVWAMADSPKQVQPFPFWSSASALAARFGGTRKRMAWWTSMLWGKNWLDVIMASSVTWGSTSVQW